MTGTKCYKAVSDCHQTGVLQSFTAHGDYTVTYTPGEEAVAPIGGLLVFDTYERARSFVSYSAWPIALYQIWEAKGFDAVELPSYRAGSCETEIYQMVWGETCKQRPWMPPWQWPSGTKAFKRVKLVKRVDSQGKS